MSMIPNTDEIKAIEVISKNAVESKYFEKLGGYAGIFSIAMYAREMGLPIMSSLFGGMTNIMGKITISPQLMNAMIRKGGHKLEIDSNDQRCIIKGIRKDTGETCTVSFSVEDARKAGIFKTGGGWDKYPSDMCFARALSRLARRLFPDVIGTSYVEGELDEAKSESKVHKLEKKEDKPLEEVETVVDVKKAEDLINEFKEKFKHLEQKPGDLSVYLETRKDIVASIQDAMKDPTGFEMFFKKQLKKREMVSAMEGEQVPLEIAGGM